jgi:hypothetical protein
MKAKITQALVLVPHNPKFCISSVPEFLQICLLGLSPDPLKMLQIFIPPAMKFLQKNCRSTVASHVRNWKSL